MAEAAVRVETLAYQAYQSRPGNSTTPGSHPSWLPLYDRRSRSVTSA